MPFFILLVLLAGQLSTAATARHAPSPSRRAHTHFIAMMRRHSPFSFLCLAADSIFRDDGDDIARSAAQARHATGDAAEL